MAERLASGKLVLDRPAEAVARLRIDNPERRNALDHEILDAIAEVAAAARPRHRDPLRPDHRRAADLLRRLRHRRDPGADLRARRRGPGRPPLPRRDGGDRQASLADRGGDQRPLPRRRPRAGDHLRPADLRGRGEAGDAAGETGADLRPYRPAPLPRHDRPGADEGDVPDRAQLRGGPGGAASASSTKSSTTSSSRRTRSSSRPRSPPTRRSRCAATSRRSTCSTPARSSATSRRPA